MEIVGNIIHHDHNLAVIKNYFLKFYFLDTYTNQLDPSIDQNLDNYLQDKYQSYVENNKFVLDDYDCVYIAFTLASICNYDLLLSLKIDNKVLAAYRMFTDYMVKNWYHLFKHETSTSERLNASSISGGTFYA